MTSATTARVDWFARTEKTNFDRTSYADRTYSFDAPVDASLADILALGYAQRIPRGSQRAGCFEIQTSLGIWTSPRGRMNPRTAVFKSWQQLEAEE